MNLNEMTLSELKQLKKNVDKAIQSFEDRQKQAALAALEATASEHGYKLGDLLGTKKAKAPAAPKYRNPDNSAETWSGRGRKPLWFVKALESGTSEAEMAI